MRELLLELLKKAEIKEVNGRPVSNMDDAELELVTVRLIHDGFFAVKDLKSKLQWIKTDSKLLYEQFDKIDLTLDVPVHVMREEIYRRHPLLNKTVIVNNSEAIYNTYAKAQPEGILKEMYPDLIKIPEYLNIDGDEGSVVLVFKHILTENKTLAIVCISTGKYAGNHIIISTDELDEK